MGFSIYDEHVLVFSTQQLVAADTTVFKSLLTGSGLGQRLDAILVSNSDIIDHVVEFRMVTGVIYAPVGGVLILAGAGAGVIPAVDVVTLLPFGAPAGPLLAPNAAIQARVVVAVTAAYAVGFYLAGGAF